jgi:hypothetical protein
MQHFDAVVPGAWPTATEGLSMDSARPPELDAPPATDSGPEPLADGPAPDRARDNGKSHPEGERVAQPVSVIPPEEPSLAEASVPEPMPLAVPADGDTSALEQRMRRLEDALREIGETRVTDRPKARTARATDVSIPTAAVAPDPPTAKPAGENANWFLLELWAEARAIQYMYFDPRYRMSWHAWLIPLLLLAAFITTGWWVPGADIVGMGRLIVKAVELILAFVLFKMLAREARRYRETAPDLPPWLRL